MIPRFPDIASLSDPRALQPLFGPIADIEHEQLSGLGASGSYHERLTISLASGKVCSLMLKHIQLDRDFTVYRTGHGASREVELLSEPALKEVWDIFRCPYLAFATAPDRAALLKEDVGKYLMADIDEPISADAEDQLLTALTALHARYWNSEAISLSWLCSTTDLFGVLGPHIPSSQDSNTLAHPLLQNAHKGWVAAFKHLPLDVIDTLNRSPAAIASDYSALPQTVLHGDTKIANFAFEPNGRVAAFDWALMSFAPATLDLGWYLAVNSSRLARPKEQVIERYRSLLQAALGSALPESLWRQMLSVGILHGALMLLWEKALNLEARTSGAVEEWAWWVQQLSRL